MDDRERKNKSTLPIGKIIGLLLVLNFLPAEVFAVILLIGMAGFLIFCIVKAARTKGRSQKRSADVFDDCPKTFCFHKDKGEHHLRKGKEIDPWDRPDIDISKYQRK